MDVRVISIGTLAVNDLWHERAPRRTGHATTTLIRSGDATLLVDPGLPAPALEARLAERVNLGPDAITHVFLTSFRPDCWRGIELFENAVWLIGEAERESAGVPLAQAVREAAMADDIPAERSPILARARHELAVLQRCRAAPDRPIDGVALFPLPGVTAGLTGLLVEARNTVLVTGDAIATQDHLAAGRVAPPVQDPEAARESFREALEIADVLVLGRDNAVPNPVRRPF